MREHKIDMERAFLFNQKAKVGGVQYSEGLVGHIIKNSTVVGGTTNLSYDNVLHTVVINGNLSHNQPGLYISIK